MARALGDAPTLAFALYRLAQVTWFRREFAAARDIANEGVGVARMIGNANLEGINLWQVAQASQDLAEPDAEALAARAVDIFTEVQNATMLGCALTTLAQVHLGRGDLAGARQLVDRAVAAHPVEFSGVAQMFSNVNLGWVATLQGDLTAAHAALLAALRMARDVLGAQARLVTPLEGLAQLASAAGQPVRALRLAGAASRLRRQFTTPPTPTEVRLLQGWMNHARSQLTRENAEAAWASGERLTSQQAIADALALELRTMTRPVDGLTNRERQVALLVAAGAGTREIAEQLVISRNTARVHVERILSKLGLHSRAQLAIWATQRNLLADSVDANHSVGISGELESVGTH
jgi:non-specific serine/threonine protein kinase